MTNGTSVETISEDMTINGETYSSDGDDEEMCIRDRFDTKPESGAASGYYHRDFGNC